MDKKKMATKEKVFVACCVVVGLIIGVWITNRMYKPLWQTREDEEIELRKQAGEVDEYIFDKFILTLRPDGKTKYAYSSAGGEKVSYQEMYEYASKKLGYKCQQLQQYDENTPVKQLAKCEKI